MARALILQGDVNGKARGSLHCSPSTNRFQYHEATKSIASLDGMPVHQGIIPSSESTMPIHTPILKVKVDNRVLNLIKQEDCGG